MYCPKCGVALNEEAKFCPQCGETINKADSNANLNNGLNNSNYSFIYNVKSIFASSQFFALCIVYTVSFAIGIAISLVDSVAKATKMNASTAGVGGVNFSFNGKATSILILISLWLIYSWAKNNTSKLSSGGFTVLNVVLIIKIVENIILLAVVPILLIGYAAVCIIASMDRMEYLVLSVAVVGAVVLCLLIAIPSLIISINMRKSVKNVDNHLKYGTPLIPVSGSVKVTSVIIGIMEIVVAILSVVGLAFMKDILPDIASLFSDPGVMPIQINLYSTALSSVGSVLSGVTLAVFFFMLPRFINLFNNSVRCQYH